MVHRPFDFLRASPQTIASDTKRHGTLPVQGIESLGSTRLAVEGRLRECLPAGLISGIVATSVFTIGLLAVGGLASVFSEKIAFDLGSPMVALMLVLNSIVGLVWASVYAGIFVPAIGGPGWQKGVVYSMFLWSISLTVLLPGSWLNESVLGFEAGLFPIFASLALHLLYGAVLGHVYNSNRFMTETGQPTDAYEAHVLQRVQRSMALSLLPGSLAGLAVGLIAGNTLAPGFDLSIVVAVTTMLGAGVGLLFGSFYALTPADR